MGCIKEADSSDYQATYKTAPELAQSNQDSTGDPVNVVTGAFTLREQEVSFPTQRLRIELARNYNNQHHKADRNAPPGPFGRGWTHSFHLYLQPGPQPGQITYMDDQGSPIEFQPDDTPTYTPVSGAPAITPAWEKRARTYIAPPGAIGMELVQTETGTFRLRQIDGLIAYFDALGRITALVRPGFTTESRVDLRY